MMHVELRHGEYVVVAGDKTLASSSSLEAALNAAREAIGSTKRAVLHDARTKQPNGAWRWLPATANEEAAVKGVRIDEQAIREMALSLNERVNPIPIDGGPTPHGMMASDVHGTAMTAGATPANGWAHWGVVVRSANVTELYLWCEVVPEVAREIDTGRVAFGSVHFGWTRLEGDIPRGCVLESHALTNTPAVTTLLPASALRGAELRGANPLTGAARAATRGLRMNTQTAPAAPAAESVRGPSEDTLAALYQLLGIDPADPEAGSKLVAAVTAMHGGEDVAPEAPETELELAAADMPSPEVADAASADAFTAQVTELLRQVFDLPEGDSAALLDKLNSNIDLIKGALASVAPAADAPAAAMKSAEVAIASSTVRALTAKLTEENSAMRAKLDEHNDMQWLDSEIAKRGGLVGVDQRTALVGLRAKAGSTWREVCSVALASIVTPPTQQVFRSKQHAAVDSNVQTDFQSAFSAEVDLAQKAGMSLRAASKRAAEEVAKKFPHLVAGE